MGCGPSTPEGQRDAAINRDLRRDRSMEGQIVKILLLGAGESGKSTIVKQMKLLTAVDGRESNGFTEEDRAEARSAIYANILDSMSALFDAQEMFGVALGSNKLEEEKAEVRQFIEQSAATGHPTTEVVEAISALWQSPPIQAVYARRNGFQLNDSAQYFLSDVGRLCGPDYVPSDQDVLRTRVKTTGIVKIEFVIKKTRFRMFDVGGQRSERKKWIHCFDNVTTVLFIMALSEYDQLLYEDNETNRMHESLNLFASIVNNIHFKGKPFIVFFNKFDLFEEKIKTSSLAKFFPDYQGDNSVDDAYIFIGNKFEAQNREPYNAIYNHQTTATDTRLVEKVFVDVTDIILQQLLNQIGMK